MNRRLIYEAAKKRGYYNSIAEADAAAGYSERGNMVDNQHKKISGYRDLTVTEIDMMNELKDIEARLGHALTGLEDTVKAMAPEDREAMRWVAMARTNLETGMMFAIKAVARPTNGLGRK